MEQKCNVNKKYEHPTALAAGTTGVVVYTLCSAAVALWPIQTIGFMATWFHGIDISKIAIETSITIKSFFIGLVSVFIVIYIISFIYATLYNLCVNHCKNRKWIQ